MEAKKSGFFKDATEPELAIVAILKTLVAKKILDEDDLKSFVMSYASLHHIIRGVDPLDMDKPSDFFISLIALADPEYLKSALHKVIVERNAKKTSH